MELLIIADDFTGALDTGVQFAKCGMRTIVTADMGCDFANTDALVLVVDTESRNAAPEIAYQRAFQIVRRAFDDGIAHIYKKTDSGMRGNIGSELDAMLTAVGGGILPFIPAFPKMKRITREGIQLIDGVPVAESVFGRDPYQPVMHSAVADRIHEQTEIPVWVVPKESGDNYKSEEGILVFDAESDEDLKRIGGTLFANGDMRIFAGCAGLGGILPELFLKEKAEPVRWLLNARLLVINGSLNPITLSQLDYAEKKGFDRIRLTAEDRKSVV